MTEEMDRTVTTHTVLVRFCTQSRAEKPDFDNQGLLPDEPERANPDALR
jgi:hypothetical protein